MKRKAFIILILVVLLTMFTGCSFFEEDAEGVKDIELSRNDDNDIVVKVLYYDEYDSFKEEIIPTGLDGKDGISVDDIIVVREKDSLRTRVTVRLTPQEGEEKGKETTFYVPDGVRIESVESQYDEGTDKYFMYLVYSDGEESQPIEIPQGKTGNGIDVDQSIFEPQEDGSINCSLAFTNGKTVEFTIPAGKTGNGIESIEPDESNGTLTLTITYTSGDVVPISFTRSSLWFQGKGLPTHPDNVHIVENAIVGDYYFDITYRKIYVLTETEWAMLVDFDKGNDDLTVYFDPNDDPESPVDPHSLPDYYKLTAKYGEYLVNKIPTPRRTGYTFKGWATSAVVGPTTGFFTDLTPVMTSLTLYAIWEKDE